MEKDEAEAIIRSFVTNEVTVSYLCAFEGSTLAIYPDEIIIGIDVTEDIKHDTPLAALKCPGCECFNIDDITDEVEHDFDAGIYLANDGRGLDLDDVIWEFMDHDELEELAESIVFALLEDWEERNE